VVFEQGRDLIEEQSFQINLAKALFKSPSAVCNDLKHLIDEYVVRSNLRVPRLHELLDDHGNDAV
jgi:hypothetical protein